MNRYRIIYFYENCVGIHYTYIKVCTALCVTESMSFGIHMMIMIRIAANLLSSYLQSWYLSLDSLTLEFTLFSTGIASLLYCCLEGKESLILATDKNNVCTWKEFVDPSFKDLIVAMLHKQSNMCE